MQVPTFYGIRFGRSAPMIDRDERQSMIARLTAESESAVAMMLEYNLAPGKRARRIREALAEQQGPRSGPTLSNIPDSGSVRLVE